MYKRQAHKKDARGCYSDSDRYLLNTYLVGDHRIVGESPNYNDLEWQPDRKYKALWDSIIDPEQAESIQELPGIKYTTRLLNDSLAASSRQQACRRAKLLLENSPVKHSVMLVVTTDGKILSRAHAPGKFTKVGNGGGRREKSLVHCHFACREGVQDEFGIGFHNPAVLEVSPPWLMIQPRHDRDTGSHTLVYVQWMLLDHRQIKRIEHVDVWEKQNIELSLIHI